MITVEIAGYTLAGDNLCPDCTARWARLNLMNEGCWQTSDKDTEQLLSLLAGLLDVDREYADSDDFPVPFSGQTAETDQSWADHEQAGILRCQCGNDFLGEF